MQSVIVCNRPGQVYVDESNVKYKCCCGSTSVRTGAIIIGILDIFGILYNFYWFATSAQMTATGMAGGLVVNIALLLAVLLMFYGIKTEKAPFLLPYLGLQILRIVGSAILAVVLFILLAGGKFDHLSPDGDPRSDQVAKSMISGLAIILVVSVSFIIWFFLVVKVLYGFYKDKKAALESGAQFGGPGFEIRP